jgi:hypothetical protein
VVYLLLAQLSLIGINAKAKAGVTHMKISGRGAVLAMTLTLAPVLPTHAQTEPTSAGEARTQELVDQLKELLRAAEQERRTSPAVTKQMRDLVRRYDFPWRVTLLYDDFRDGDYTYNPRWTVSHGEFRVARGTGLRSYFDPPVSQTRRPASRRSDGSAMELLGELLTGSRQREIEAMPTHSRAEAEISTRVGITNSFVIRAYLNVRRYADQDSRVEFGPFLGDDRGSGYRLVYESGRRPSLTLLRFSPGRSAVIEMTDQDVNLGDGHSHAVEWRRTTDGEMVVLLDNKEVIKTVDRAYDEPFDGFAMVNKSGEFELKRITILGTQR